MAGDIRVGENSGLTSIQTVFAREHNRICDELLFKNAALTDEEVYQTARNKVIGFIQKITFKEFLPKLLGQTAFDQYIGKYLGYDSKINPTINV